MQEMLLNYVCVLYVGVKEVLLKYPCVVYE